MLDRTFADAPVLRQSVKQLLLLLGRRCLNARS